MHTVQAEHSDALRAHELFTGLTDAQYDRVLTRTRVRAFVAGQRIFNQGDDAAALFLVRQGALKLYRVSALGQEKIMRLAHAGDSFAESVMFMDEPRYPVNAEAIESGVLLSIDVRTYLAVLEDSFDACRNIMTKMSRRIQAHWDEIEALTLQNSRYRVIHYLLGLVPPGTSGPASITLPARKSLIATQLAVAPETLSRILNSLSEEGLADTQQYTVRIPDVGALQRL